MLNSKNGLMPNENIMVSIRSPLYPRINTLPIYANRTLFLTAILTNANRSAYHIFMTVTYRHYSVPNSRATSTITSVIHNGNNISFGRYMSKDHAIREVKKLLGVTK